MKKKRFFLPAFFKVCRISAIVIWVVYTATVINAAVLDTQFGVLKRIGLALLFLVCGLIVLNGLIFIGRDFNYLRKYVFLPDKIFAILKENKEKLLSE